MKSILVIDTPSSCSECELYTDYNDCIMLGQFVKLNERYTKRHPNCPLISIDIDELEEALNRLMMGFDKFDTTRDNDFNTIKSTIDKLKGG